MHSQNEGAAYASEMNDVEERRIPVKFDNLTEELERLDDQINRLITRISPVLGPEEPEAKDPGLDTVPAMQSDVANQLESVTKRVNILRHRVVSVTNRVEA